MLWAIAGLYGCTWIPQKETLVVREVLGDDTTEEPTGPKPPNDPPAVGVSFAAPVGTDDVLVAEVAAEDPEGAEVTVSVQWRVDGRRVEVDGLELDGAAWFDRDDQVELEVTASDGTHEVTASASIVVANTPPGAPSVVVDPPFAAAGYTPLVCRVPGEALDADGDDVDYDVRWEVNGALHVGATLTDTLPGDTVPGFETDPGQRWTCIVTATDGDDGGEGEASVDVSEGLIVDGRTVELAPGNHAWDVVEVVHGGVLSVAGEVVLESRWVHVDADSMISGSRAGWAGGNGPSQDGAGPGGGGADSGDAGSGGGNGGAGGRGGHEGASDNLAGLAYGAEDAMEAPAGSGGGGVGGGAGGAGLWIVSDVVRIEGAVFVNGGAGADGGYNESGAGGGAGGTVLLQGDEVVVHGTLGARGGNGGDGDTFQSYDGGGGGGGGRIKLVYDALLDIAGAALDVEGGARGQGVPDGDAGEPGTIWTDQAPF